MDAEDTKTAPCDPVSLRSVHTKWGRWLTLGVLAVAGAGFTGCGLIGGGECSSGDYRCTGNSVERCESPCSEPGCTTHWVESSSCSHECIELDSQNAICVLSSDKDPRCAGVNGFCDGDDAIACQAGFVVVRRQCAAPAGDAGNATKGRCVLTNGESNCQTPLTRCGGTSPQALCHPPVACGPIVKPEGRTGSAPAAQGGMLLDGVYVLSAWNEYESPVPASRLADLQTTWSVSAGVLAVAQYFGGPPSFSAGPVTTSGNRLLWTPTCPALASGGDLTYTASGTSLLVYEAAEEGGIDELVFEKQ